VIRLEREYARGVKSKHGKGHHHRKAKSKTYRIHHEWEHVTERNKPKGPL
jgi:hypothetical protein